MKRTLSMLAPLLTATLFLASCGGGTGTPAPTPTPPSSTPSDTTPPTVNLRIGQTTVKAGDPLNIAADVTDNVGVKHVEFRIDGELIGTQTQAPYTLTYMPQNSGEQSRVLTVEVRAVDAAGWATTAATTVTVNPLARTLPIYIPAAGAAVGTGDGTAVGTVYVSPTAAEVELMLLVNEVRTKGTIQGVDATVGSCVEGRFAPLGAMTYNGALAYAGRKHADYLGEVGFEAHVETATQNPAFYGATAKDRVTRAYRELAGRDAGYASGTNNVRYGGENVAGGGEDMSAPSHVLRGWMRSPGHCAAVMHPEGQMMGVGRSYRPASPEAEQVGELMRYKTNWALLVRIQPN